MHLLDDIRRDLDELCAAMAKDDTPASRRFVLQTVSWRVLVLLRVTQAARRHRLTRPLAPVLSALQLAMHGLEIHPKAQIAHGVWFVHPVGCVVGSSQVGSRVRFMGSVTLGKRRATDRWCPTVHEDAVLGAGARILGEIEVGRAAFIGANAVVLDSVPSGNVAFGNPARAKAAGDRV